MAGTSATYSSGRGESFFPALLLFFIASVGSPPRAEAESARGVAPANYQSKYFLIHTDLRPGDANELLIKLDRMLKLISTYWGRSPEELAIISRMPFLIECFVVKDLANWPAGSLDERGRKAIESGGGITIHRVKSNAEREAERNRVVRHLPLKKPWTAGTETVVYAIADHGTPQHEAVHAYCYQAFGRTGPLWYAEGMAEMGYCWHEGDSSVRCDNQVAQYLRASAPREMMEIINAETLDSGNWPDYAWRWALCHMLANNPNYSGRFRGMGLGFLNDQDVTFSQVYGAMAKEMSFEYRFFIEHMDVGYRIDLCSWDWKAKSRPLSTVKAKTSKIRARGGWQATGATLARGDALQYSTTGFWRLKKGDERVNADGKGDGAGRLLGTLMADFRLSEPFNLGSSGTLTIPSDGQLYLRCNDDWNQLDDNSGELVVKLSVNR